MKARIPKAIACIFLFCGACGLFLPAQLNHSGGNTRPVGSGTELQLRVDGTTLGAVTGSGSSSGQLAIGGTTPTRQLDVIQDVVHSSVGVTSQLSVYGTADSTQKLNIGYDTTSNYGFLEAVDESTAWQTLHLQPSGGTVGINVFGGGNGLTVGGHIDVLAAGSITYFESANVASATTVTLAAGNLFHVTGTTTITTLNTCDAANNGRLLTLVFDGVVTFTDGNNLVLAGDFVTTASDVIQLICDGSNWYETSRSVN